MGVITRMLHRSEELEIAPYRNLFLDMEENIHIHYRDLRIELSRVEFEEITNTFSKQSKELLAIINEKNYSDGKLPNSNQEDTRIWTESRLEHPVIYHPKRISIEECTDGYHIHLRNYKFLLSKKDFMVFYEAIKNMDIDSPYVSSRDDIIQLFDDNHMDFVVVKKDDENNKVSLLAANYHMSKIRTICEKIGLTREGNINQYTFSNEQAVIEVSSSSRSEINKLKKMFSNDSSSLLASYLLNTSDINSNELNYIKCQVLNVFEYVKQADKTPNIDLDFINWTYDRTEQKVNFPFKFITKELSISEINAFYKEWTSFQKQNDWFFVKTDKVVFDDELQEETREKIYDEILSTVATIDGVSKIYVMGSIVRKSMGIYRKPFIHSSWAKLGSDVDIMIEMEDEKSKIPEKWEFVNVSLTNSCDIYHLSQVKLDDKFGFETEFPYVNFFHHLLDAYVYIPAKSDVNKKNAFLKKFGGKLLYSSNKKDLPEIEVKKKVLKKRR